MSRVAIVGSGSFGCVLANLISNNGHDVKIWAFDPAERDIINNEHRCKYIENGFINKNILATSDINFAIHDTEFIILVTPSFAIRSTCEQMKDVYNPKQSVVVASKGMEYDEETNSIKTLSEVASEVLGTNIGVISGPSHAEQIFRGVKTGVALYEPKNPDKFRALFRETNLELEDCNDPYGMQICAALKNIVAIGVGKEDPDGYSSNAGSTAFQRGLFDMILVCDALNVDIKTVLSPAGVGDLYTTCSSLDSRNKRCGILLGQGKTLDEIKNEVGMTIEGLNALNAAHAIIKKYGIKAKMMEDLYQEVKEKERTEGKSLSMTF
jgi:glycerol-3-phosphate dehydrogenase (NAD(P)+)